jgi:hypothetical protein
MLTRSSIYASTLICLSSISYADSDTIQIPEGKLQNHASLFGDITPSAGPRVIDGYGVFLTGDYIYWTAREDGLEFAISGVNTPSSGVNHLPVAKGQKYDPRFRFKSGFKAGVGFSFGHDKWDMYLNYTWFNSHNNHKTAGKKGSQPLSNLIPLALSNEYSMLTTARGIWDLNFNVIDGSLGRNFYVSKFLSLRPFFGAKGTYQKQKYHITYDFANEPDMKIHNKNNFWGIGLMAGVNTAWHLAGTWSLFADLALSSLWGNFNVSRKDVSGSTTYYDVAEGFHTIKPVIEIGAGIRKEDWFDHDRYHVSVQAGWEQQVWYSQNQFDFYRCPRQGDLNIQGFTAKIRFDF